MIGLPHHNFGNGWLSFSGQATILMFPHLHYNLLLSIQLNYTGRKSTIHRNCSKVAQSNLVPAITVQLGGGGNPPPCSGGCNSSHKLEPPISSIGPSANCLQFQEILLSIRKGCGPPEHGMFLGPDIWMDLFTVH